MRLERRSLPSRGAIIARIALSLALAAPAVVFRLLYGPGYLRWLARRPPYAELVWLELGIAALAALIAVGEVGSFKHRVIYLDDSPSDILGDGR
jgi:hypothetical protein